MPVYNGEKYLKESIESILNQTYDNFEFLIIDDGSADSSLDIINNYAKIDNRIIIVSRENKGLVYSLNEGIKMAKGKYIARMDSDDICFNNRFEEQTKFLEINKDVHILGTKVFTIDENGLHKDTEIEERYGISIDKKKDLLGLFLKENIICHPSVMMRKSFIKNIDGYREIYKCAEDYDLWLRSISLGYKIENINKCLLKYRVHSESKSSVETKSLKTIEDMINIRLDNVKDKFDKKSMKYLIWGASKAGLITYKAVQEKLSNFKFKAFIDSYKDGTINGNKIINPVDISNYEVDYIFIATKPGKIEAENYLKSMNLKQIDDYLWMV